MMVAMRMRMFIFGLLGSLPICLSACLLLAACSGSRSSGPRCHDSCLSYEQVCGLGGIPQACTGPDPDGCFGWKSLPACPQGQSCVDGSCACDLPCRQGETICGPGGGLVACDGQDENGCLSWSLERACPPGQSCQAGACVCDEPCQAGDALCGPGDGVITCTGPDADGCTAWAAERACPGGQLCSEGDCACLEPCQPGQVRCGPDGGLTTCLPPEPGQGCARFGPEQACPAGQVCLAGECTCPEACLLGETMCADQGVSTCQQLDPDGCLAWSQPEACDGDQVCVQGGCACADPCSQGQTLCSAQGEAIVSCEGPDEAGCYGWGQETPCAKGLVCKPDEGLCRPDTPPECYEANECNYEGEKICMTDVKYRSCKYGYDGCLIWDCST